MTWSLVTSTGATGGTAATYTPVYQSAVSAGDLCLLWAVAEGDGTTACVLSIDAGWTLIDSVSTAGADDGGLYCWYCIAGTGGSVPSMTITRTGGDRFYTRSIAYRHSGGAPTKGAHALAASVAAASTATLSGGVTAASAGALIVSLMTSGKSATGNAITATDPSADSASGSTTSTIATGDPISGSWLRRFVATTTAGTGSAWAWAEAVKSTSGSTGSITWTKNNSTAVSSVLAVVFEPPGSGGGDTTAPTLTSPTGTATGPTSASGTVSTNEATGSLFYLASTNASEDPAVVIAASSQAVSATGSQSVSFTGLTASTTYYAHYVHRDSSGNDSAVASSASFTTSAAPDTTPPTLTGSITISALTTTSYTATWPAGSDNVAVTGYEYRIAAGSWVDRGNNLSVNITGRTPGATETFEVRAYDAAGNRSTPALSTSVTLLSAVPTVTVTEPLRNNTGTLLASQSGITASVLSASTLASVHTATGLTTNASGLLAAISNASITTGQQYHVAIKLADGGVGITGPITAS